MNLLYQVDWAYGLARWPGRSWCYFDLWLRISLEVDWRNKM